MINLYILYGNAVHSLSGWDSHLSRILRDRFVAGIPACCISLLLPEHSERRSEETSSREIEFTASES